MKVILASLFISLSFATLTSAKAPALDFQKQLKSYQDFQNGLKNYQAGDFRTALREWRPLAEQVDEADPYYKGAAQYYLGLMYAEGIGVPQDDKMSVKWYRLAAEHGIAEAQYNLGNYFFVGKGITQDYKQAANLYRLAAEQGLAAAQSTLGVMYANGYGIKRDLVIAYMWVNIAVSNNYSLASQNVNIFAKNMTAAEISKAKQLAQECVAKNYKGC